MAPCPLCKLGFPEPHTTEDWRKVSRMVHAATSLCEHGVRRMDCDDGCYDDHPARRILNQPGLREG